ncbi:MAG: hypothetical protein R2766_09395 [Saprospiraceae bacterium]
MEDSLARQYMVKNCDWRAFLLIKGIVRAVLLSVELGEVNNVED